MIETKAQILASNPSAGFKFNNFAAMMIGLAKTQGN
jgi:hypothetical protein